MTTCARSSAGTARGIFDCGDAAGVGAATAWGGDGVGLSDGTEDSFESGRGLFSGFGVSIAFGFPFPFAVLDFGFGDALLFRVDFFFAAFVFGVAPGDFFGLGEETVGSGVSLGFGFGVVSSSSLDFFAPKFRFGLGLGDSSGVADAAALFFDFCFTAFAFAIGLGDSSGVGDETASVCWRLRFSSSLTCA
jgi:hypothetical protein